VLRDCIGYGPRKPPDLPHISGIGRSRIATGDLREKAPSLNPQDCTVAYREKAPASQKAERDGIKQVRGR